MFTSYDCAVLTMCTTGVMDEYKRKLRSGDIQVSVIVQRRPRAIISLRVRQLLFTSYILMRRS